jgi:hypothetical protein
MLDDLQSGWETGGGHKSELRCTSIKGVRPAPPMWGYTGPATNFSPQVSPPTTDAGISNGVGSENVATAQTAAVGPRQVTVPEPSK